MEKQCKHCPLKDYCKEPYCAWCVDRAHNHYLSYRTIADIFCSIWLNESDTVPLEWINIYLRLYDKLSDSKAVWYPDDECSSGILYKDELNAIISTLLYESDFAKEPKGGEWVEIPFEDPIPPAEVYDKWYSEEADELEKRAEEAWQQVMDLGI